MEYISHENYKKMMDGFKKGSPKKALNEMHTMDDDDHDEFHKLPADAEEGLEKEGNAFTAGLAKTKKGGQFKVGDKEFTDKTNYDAPIDEEDVSKDAHGAAYHIGDKVKYEGHSFTIMIGAGGTVVLKHSSGRIIPHDQSMEILRQAAIDKKFHDLDEEWDSPYDGGADDLAAMARNADAAKAKIVGHVKNDVYKVQTPSGDVIDLDFELEKGDQVDDYAYEGTLYAEDDDYEYILPVALIVAGGGSYDVEPYYKEFSAHPKKKVNEYQFDQMYPDDPGPFEGKNVDSVIKEFLARESAVNWDAVDDEEAEQDETDDGMEEALNPAPFQATGPTIQTVEEESNVAHLTSEEREQVKQYIESIKTIKEQIAKLMAKGKMEESGDTTGLVMKPTTVSEDDMAQGGVDHEKIESQLNPKFHEAFHKITGMIIGDLIKAGFPEDQIKNFLDHEIEEKAKEWTSGQYGENKLRK